jgi:hypothetical protein
MERTEIDSFKAKSGTWILYNDEADKTINVVLMRNNVPMFLVECPEFYDCPVHFLLSLSKQVLHEPMVIRWLIQRYNALEGL